MRQRAGPNAATELKIFLAEPMETVCLWIILSAMNAVMTPPKYRRTNGAADKNPLDFRSNPWTDFKYFDSPLIKTPSPKPLVKSAKMSPIKGSDVMMDFQGTDKVPS